MAPSRSVYSTGTSLAGSQMSPTGSLATARASIDFPRRPEVLVTRADLRSSVSSYEGLLASGKALTNAMLVLSRAAADFAASLETCSKIKGAHVQAENLQACAGLHFLTSNWSQVLADSFWKEFQIPLLSAFDTYRHTCNERQLMHDKLLADKSRALKETEARNIRNGLGRRGPGRDLASFKLLLAEMQRQVTEIDEAKADYYHEVLGAEEEMWEFIQSKISLMSRSQVEIWERLSSKANSDPVLEHLLASIPDPFDSYGTPPAEDQILSIIPPSNLLSSYAPNQMPRTVPTSGSASGSAAAAAALSTHDTPKKRSMAPNTPTKGKLVESKSPRLRDEALFEPSDSEDSKVDADYAILTAPASQAPTPEASTSESSIRDPASATKEGKVPAVEPPPDRPSGPGALRPDDGDKRLGSIREEEAANTSLSDGEDGVAGKFPGSPSALPASSSTGADQTFSSSHHPPANDSSDLSLSQRSSPSSSSTKPPTDNVDLVPSRTPTRPEVRSENDGDQSDSGGDMASDTTVDALPPGASDQLSHGRPPFLD